MERIDRFKGGSVSGFNYKRYKKYKSVGLSELEVWGGGHSSSGDHAGVRIQVTVFFCFFDADGFEHSDAVRILSLWQRPSQLWAAMPLFMLAGKHETNRLTSSTDST